MSLWERLAEITKGLLTTDTELKHLNSIIADVRQEVPGLTHDMQDVRERLTRLEASREVDRAQAQAEISRFKAEVERAEMRLSRLLPPNENPPV